MPTTTISLGWAMMDDIRGFMHEKSITSFSKGVQYLINQGLVRVKENDARAKNLPK